MKSVEERKVVLKVVDAEHDVIIKAIILNGEVKTIHLETKHGAYLGTDDVSLVEFEAYTNAMSDMLQSIKRELAPKRRTRSRSGDTGVLVCTNGGLNCPGCKACPI